MLDSATKELRRYKTRADVAGKKECEIIKLVDVSKVTEAVEQPAAEEAADAATAGIDQSFVTRFDVMLKNGQSRSFIAFNPEDSRCVAGRGRCLSGCSCHRVFAALYGRRAHHLTVAAAAVSPQCSVIALVLQSYVCGTSACSSVLVCGVCNVARICTPCSLVTAVTLPLSSFHCCLAFVPLCLQSLGVPPCHAVRHREDDR